jgi:hypothetical protein
MAAMVSANDAVQARRVPLSILFVPVFFNHPAAHCSGAGLWVSVP